MGSDEDEVDEERRRRFEAHRLAGGSDPVAAFVPPPGDPAYAATLEELVAIDLEFRWKAWTRGDPAPELADYDAVLDGAAPPEVRERLAREAARLAAKFGAALRAREGLRLSHYVLRSLAGSGAFAEVWRASDERLKREVAVKIARPELAGEPGVTARLVREAHSAARLRHPGIVTVHEVGDTGGQPYIVSDFVDGPTLEQAMRERRFDAATSARIVQELAEALAYAHACGVVHRDVKPGNVLLAGGSRPVLADFGVAHLRAADVALTRHGEVVGTPAYMSPEQARGDRAEADERSDVYSLGVVLYELLTGRRPHERGTSDSTLYAVVHEEAPPLRSVLPGVAEDLETICARAMAKEPDRRYPSARDFAEDLRRWLAKLPILSRPLGPLGRARLWARRNPAFALTVAAGVVALLAVGGVGLERVLAERKRFRSERDRANENLHLARLAEADAQVRARDSEWFDRTIGAVREAAALDVPKRDVRAMRDLVLRAHSQHAPSFRRLARWDASGGACLAIAPSPSGGELAAVTEGGSVWLREIPSGRIVTSVSLADARPRRIAYLGADAVAVGCGDGSLRILSVPKLDPLRPPREGDAPVESIAVGGDGSRIAVGRASGTVDVFRVWPEGRALEAQPRRLAAHEGGTFALAFSPDGARLASGGMDAAIRVWSDEGTEPVVVQRVSDPPRALQFSPEHDQLVWSTWEAGWGRLHLAPVVAESHHGVHLASVRSVAYCGAETVVTSSADETIRAFHFGGEPLTIARGGAGPVDAAVVIAASRRVIAAHADGSLAVWDLVEPPGRTVFATPHAARFLPGGGRLATGAGVVDLERALPSRPFPEPQVWGVAASPDGKWIATSDHGGAVVLRDAGTFGVAREFASGGGTSWTVAFSPDGRTLVAGIEGAAVAFDAATGRETARVATGVDLVTGLAFHPTLPVLAISSSDGVLRLGPSDASSAPEFHRCGAALHEVAFSPDGARLAAACSDGAVLLWEGAFDRPRPPDRRLDAGGGAAWAVAFDRQGRYVATGTERGIVVLFDATSFAPLATIACEIRRVRSLSFDDAGRFLAAGCYNGRSMAWDLPVLRAALAELALDW